MANGSTIIRKRSHARPFNGTVVARCHASHTGCNSLSPLHYVRFHRVRRFLQESGERCIRHLYASNALFDDQSTARGLIIRRQKPIGSRFLPRSFSLSFRPLLLHFSIVLSGFKSQEYERSIGFAKGPWIKGPALRGMDRIARGVSSSPRASES